MSSAPDIDSPAHEHGRRAFVVGHPVAHSRSPLIHGHWLAELGLAGRYERVDVAPADFPAFLRGFRDQGFAGGNLTIPHKEAAFALVDETTDLARRIGAVNTIWVEPDGRLIGHNTDAIGFAAALDEQIGIGWERDAGEAVILGAGGAARAILVGLLQRGLERISLVNRTAKRAQALCALDPGRVRLVAPEAVEQALETADLLVNTTSLGMTGQPPLLLSLTPLPEHAIVADIVYVPLETALLRTARARGLRTADGLGMLLHQAVPGFRAWFGGEPAVTPALRALIAADVERGK